MQAIILHNEFKNHTIKITAMHHPGAQWVNNYS